MNSVLLRVPVEGLNEGEQLLDRAVARYILRVRRLGRGARLLLFDPGVCLQAEAELIDDNLSNCVVLVGSIERATAVPCSELTLIQGIGKGDKFEQVLRDATVLGATTIIAVDAERSLRRSSVRTAEKHLRWRRICIQAARQCGRGNIPKIENLVELSAAWGELKQEQSVWLLDANGKNQLGVLLQNLRPQSPIALCVGPEGGWSPAEIEWAEKSGALLVRAWPYILRTETAATAALGAIAAALYSERSH